MTFLLPNGEHLRIEFTLILDLLVESMNVGDILPPEKPSLPCPPTDCTGW